MKAKKVISLTMAAAMAMTLGIIPEKVAHAEGEEQTLNVAVVETAYGAQMWHDVCDAFEKANPGVTINLTIDKKMEDIIMPAMKAGDYPDLL